MMRARGLLVAIAVVAGCGGAEREAEAALDPADFVEAIDNPYLPLIPGTRWVYEGVVDGEHERIEVEVTAERKEVLGIPAVVVSDTSYVDGQLVAQTFDWYAQDRAGNVWYLGEATEEYEDGELVGTEGSWEAGVDGAEAGIFMLAEPTVGDTYLQHDEDSAEVRRTGVDHGGYHDVVVIEERSPTEPDVVEEKYYAPGVGKIDETQTAGGHGGTELVEHTPPSAGPQLRWRPMGA